MKLFQPIQGSIESKETQENLIDRGQLLSLIQEFRKVY